MTYSPNIGKKKMLRAEALDAAGVRKVPKPKHRWCSHDTCAADRTLAAQPCSRCSEPLGFETDYVIEHESTVPFEPSIYRHAACVLPPNSQF